MKKLFFLIAIIGLFSCSTGNEKAKGSTETGTLVEASLNIGGMHCENCVASIEKGVGELEGIKSVDVTLEDSTALVKYDASQLAMSDIEKAVEKRGFSVKK